MEKVLVDVTKVNNVWKMEIMAELIYSFPKQCGDYGEVLNPFSSTSDLNRISPYIISMISSRRVMRIQKGDY